MKNQIMRVALLVIILIGFCCSYTLVRKSRYTCEGDNVESIQIVCLAEYHEDSYEFDYDILCEIDDIPFFVEQLNKVKCSMNWGEPLQLDTGHIAIRINYYNGDSDLLQSSAQWINRSNRTRYGFFFFDEMQFKDLISPYLH